MCTTSSSQSAFFKLIYVTLRGTGHHLSWECEGDENVKIDRTPAELWDRSIKYILTVFHMSSMSPNFIRTIAAKTKAMYSGQKQKQASQSKHRWKIYAHDIVHNWTGPQTIPAYCQSGSWFLLCNNTHEGTLCDLKSSDDSVSSAGCVWIIDGASSAPEERSQAG